jgi:hypothetical protein
MTTARGNLGKADTVTIAAIEANVPTLVEARVLVESFHAIVRTKFIANLDSWIATASLSLIASFASGIVRTGPRSLPPSPSLGRMARQKARSRN